MLFQAPQGLGGKADLLRFTYVGSSILLGFSISIATRKQS